MFVITGGAGNVVRFQHRRCSGSTRRDIVISDPMGANDFKWRNVAKRRLFDIIPPEATAEFLNANQEKVGGVFHVGAISATTETDIDAIVRKNVRTLSIELWKWSRSSTLHRGATYGDGREGSLDRFYADYLSRLQPPMPMG